MDPQVPDLAASTAAPAPLDACWHRIGVYGDGTCPELKQYNHCRNCPVHSQAASQMLNRPLPEQALAESTKRFSTPRPYTEQPRDSVVLFRIGTEWLALPTRAFQEIAERRPIHSLPHRSEGVVLGLANVRGELLVCASLGRLLGLPEAQATAARGRYDRLMVLDWDGQRFGFPVEEVQGPQRFNPAELKPVPATLAGGEPVFTSGMLEWQQHAVGLLDPDLVVSALNRKLS